MENLGATWLAINDVDPLDLAVSMNMDTLDASRIDPVAYMDFQACETLDDEIEWFDRFTNCASPIASQCTPTDWYGSYPED